MSSTTYSPQPSAFNRDDAPPQYEDSTSNQPQISQQPISSQNSFEDSNAPQNFQSQESASTPSGAIYEENMYGEMKPSSARTGGDRFGADTDEKSAAYRSDETYEENRFGELGRADTFEETPRKRDKLIGTAEQVLGKVTHNQELHDKGVARKSPPRSSMSPTNLDKH